MPRSHEATAALAVQLSDHIRACSLCKMPADVKQWEGVVLCPPIGDWLDLNFPEDAGDTDDARSPAA